MYENVHLMIRDQDLIENIYNMIKLWQLGVRIRPHCGKAQIRNVFWIIQFKHEKFLWGPTKHQKKMTGSWECEKLSCEASITKFVPNTDGEKTRPRTGLGGDK